MPRPEFLGWSASTEMPRLEWLDWNASAGVPRPECLDLDALAADVKNRPICSRIRNLLIITGYEVFPELDSYKDDKEIECQFQNNQFPVDPSM